MLPSDRYTTCEVAPLALVLDAEQDRMLYASGGTPRLEDVREGSHGSLCPGDTLGGTIGDILYHQYPDQK